MWKIFFPFIISAVIPVMGQPSLVSVSPAQGEQGTALGVTITGLSTQFGIPGTISGMIIWSNNIDSIYLNNQQDTVYSSKWNPLSETQAYAWFNLAEPTRTGDYDLTVVQKDPHAGMKLRQAYKVITPPPATITALCPDSGMQSIPLVVTISGTNTLFGISQASPTYAMETNVDSVYFQNQQVNLPARSVVAINADSLKAEFHFSDTAPAGLYDLVVVQDSPDVRMVLTQKFKLLPGRNGILTAASPATFIPGQTFNIAIAGTATAFGLPRLQSNGTVFWDRNVDSVLLSNSNRTIAARTWSVADQSNLSANFISASDDPPGAYDLIVVQNQPPAKMMLPGAIRLVRPSLVRIAPDSGYQGRLCNVTITGLNTRFGNPQQFSPTTGNVASVYLRNSSGTINASAWSAYGPKSDTLFPALFIPVLDNTPGVYDVIVVQRDPSVQLELPGAFRLLRGTAPVITLSPDSGMSAAVVTSLLSGAFYNPSIDSVVLSAKNYSVKATFAITVEPVLAIVRFTLPAATVTDTCRLEMYCSGNPDPLVNDKGFRIYPARTQSVAIMQNGCAFPGGELNLSVTGSNITLAYPIPWEHGYSWYDDFDIEVTNGVLSFSQFAISIKNNTECTLTGTLPGTFTPGLYRVLIKTGSPSTTFTLTDAVYIATRDSCQRDTTKVVAPEPAVSRSPAGRQILTRCGKGYLLNRAAFPQGTTFRMVDLNGRTVGTFISSVAAGPVMISRPSGVYFLSAKSGRTREIVKLVFHE